MHTYIIYLAAGNSRRFGTNKLLYRYGEKALYRYGFDMLEEVCRENPECSLRVVSQYEEILDYAKGRGIPAIYSPDSKYGASYTIRAAIGTLVEVKKEDYLMFVVADQPYLTKRTVEKMLKRAKSGSADEIDVVVTSYKGRRGNPILFSSRLIPELLALRGDEGGRKVAGNCQCIYVEAEEKELYDIDLPGEAES